MQKVVRGVDPAAARLDAQIAAVSRGWQVRGLGFVDRSILRLAIYEIVFVDEVPVRWP